MNVVHREFFDWREILRELVGGNKALVDLLFQKLMQHREPTAAHRFMAALSSRIDIRLILTTNFDNLIEVALRDEGVSPVVFELPENGPIPHGNQVRSELAVVKLHGGTFALRVGESLDEPLSRETLESMSKYLPDDAVIVVLGYGGGDLRVMSLLSHWAMRANGRNPRVVWITRKTFPRLLKRMSEDAGDAIEIHPYPDCALFLQAWYEYTASSQPVSRKKYRIVRSLSAWTPMSEETMGAHRFIAFVSNQKGSGTSTLLAQCFETASRRYRPIWCDLEDFGSVDQVVRYLLDEFAQFDQNVEPVMLSSIGVRDRRKLRSVQVRRIIEALRRAKYFLGFDSVGEFARMHIAGSGVDARDSDEQVQERLDLIDFIEALARSASQMGESRIAVAIAIDRDGERATSEGQQFYASVERLKGLLSDDLRRAFCKIESPVVTPTLINRGSMNEWVSEDRVAEICEIPNDLSLVITRLWAHMQAKDCFDCARCILEVASAFRRPRSGVMLRRACLAMGLVATRYDAVLQQLAATGLLSECPGNHYFMHRAVRDYVYRKSDPRRVGVVHDVIAGCFHDAFLRSGDFEAFREYVFHRKASLFQGGLDQGSIEMWSRELISRLREHFRALLADVPAGIIADWLRSIRMHVRKQLLGRPDTLATLESLFLDLEAVARQEAADFLGCMRIRFQELSGETLPESCRSCVPTPESFLSGEANAGGGAGEGAGWLVRVAAALPDARSKVLHIAKCLKGLRVPQCLDILKYLRGVVSDDWERLSHVLREIDYHLAVNAWTKPEEPNAVVGDHVTPLFEEAESILNQSVNSHKGSFAVLRVNLFLYRARVKYLGQKFEDAIADLELAEAELHRSAFSLRSPAFAVVALHFSECYMLQSTRLVDDGAAPVLVHFKLKQAEQAISRCRRVLSEARTKVWWWTQAYLKTAQLWHEKLLLVSEEREDRNWREMVRGALRAIRLGVDNVSWDTVRHCELRSLGVQIFCVFADMRLRSGVSSEGVREEWGRMDVSVEVDDGVADFVFSELNALRNVGSRRRSLLAIEKGALQMLSVLT